MNGPTGCCRRNLSPNILRSRTNSQTTASAGVDLRRNLLENSVFDFLIPPHYHLPRTLHPSPSIDQTDGEGNGERYPLEGGGGGKFRQNSPSVKRNPSPFKSKRTFPSSKTRLPHFPSDQTTTSKRLNTSNRNGLSPDPPSIRYRGRTRAAPSPPAWRGSGATRSHRQHRQFPAPTKKPGSLVGNRASSFSV